MINIITSYPKSGNTWIRFIVFNILFNKEGNEFNSKDIEKFVPDFHKIIKNNSELILDKDLINEKIFIKTHYDYLKVKSLSIDKVILILRNPLDVLSSIINYYDIKKEDLNNLVDEFSTHHNLSIFKIKYNFPSYSEHIKSWTDSGKDLLIINYSELITNFEKTVKNLSNFINENTDEKKIKLIKEKTDFNNLLDMEKFERKNKIDGFFSSSVSNQNYFMNKGKNKTYENLFNQDQIKKLEESFFEIIQKYNMHL